LEAFGFFAAKAAATSTAARMSQKRQPSEEDFLRFFIGILLLL
jgi:hypothetical protein